MSNRNTHEMSDQGAGVILEESQEGGQRPVLHVRFQEAQDPMAMQGYEEAQVPRAPDPQEARQAQVDAAARQQMMETARRRLEQQVIAQPISQLRAAHAQRLHAQVAQMQESDPQTASTIMANWGYATQRRNSPGSWYQWLVAEAPGVAAYLMPRGVVATTRSGRDFVYDRLLTSWSSSKEDRDELPFGDEASYTTLSNMVASPNRRFHRFYIWLRNLEEELNKRVGRYERNLLNWANDATPAERTHAGRWLPGMSDDSSDYEAEEEEEQQEHPEEDEVFGQAGFRRQRND